MSSSAVSWSIVSVTVTGVPVGISLVTLLLARNLQVSHADLAAHVTPYSLPPVNPAITQGAALTDTAIAMLDAEINRQALMIAYIDDFHVMMLVALCALPLVLLLRKGGAPAGGQPAVAD